MESFAEHFPPDDPLLEDDVPELWERLAGDRIDALDFPGTQICLDAVRGHRPEERVPFRHEAVIRFARGREQALLTLDDERTAPWIKQFIRVVFAEPRPSAEEHERYVRFLREMDEHLGSGRDTAALADVRPPIRRRGRGPRSRIAEGDAGCGGPSVVIGPADGVAGQLGFVKGASSRIFWKVLRGCCSASWCSW